MLSDAAYASREHDMLRRLEIGLVSDGLHVLRAVPAEGDLALASADVAGLDAVIRFRRVWPPIGPQRPAAVLERALLSHLDSLPTPSSAADQGIDVIHVWGHGLWDAAIEFAELTQADLALEVGSRAALESMASAERAGRRLAEARGRGVWLVPDEAMREAALRRARLWPVELVPWGVHVGEARDADWPDTGPIGVCVMSAGLPTGSGDALLEGLARVRDRRELRVYMDAAPLDASQSLWRRARSLGLLDLVSMIDGLEARRRLVLETHLLIQPDAVGDHSTLTLDAMGHGLLVLARRDPLVSWIHEKNAMILNAPGAAEWSAALEQAFADAPARRTIIDAARAEIAASRPAHRHVAATVQAYQRVRTKGVPPPIPIR